MHPGRRHILGLFLQDLLGPHRRTARMTGLLAGILLLSGADLFMTLTHLRGIGMVEVNPIARSVIAHHSQSTLVLWKTATVLLAIGILFYARRRAVAEVGAVIGCSVLVCLTLQWTHYNASITELTSELNTLTSSPSEDGAWMTVHPGG